MTRSAVSGDLELEPRTPRHPHLRSQPEKPAALQRLDAPEVDRIPAIEMLWIAPAATHPRSTHEEIEKAAQLPQPVAVIPADAAADSFDNAERGRGRNGHVHRSRIHEA